MSYPDLRLIDASGLVSAEHISVSSPFNERQIRFIGSSLTDLDHIEYPLQSSEEIQRTSMF